MTLVSPKDWRDDPDHTTPITAAALEDLEVRLGAYALACGRLTLVTGDPAPTADQTGKTVLYYTPCEGARIGLYDGTNWGVHSFAEFSLTLPTLTSGKNYDVFVYDNAGTPTLELSAAWSSDTARTDAIVLQDGAYVKSAAKTRRYVGTIRTTSTTTTEDSAAKRFVWNAYNRRRRALKRVDATASWVYSTNTWRQANGAAANQVEAVQGLAEDAVEVELDVSVDLNAAQGRVAIGVDSTTAPHADSSVPYVTTGGQGMALHAGLRTTPAAGYHSYVWLERDPGGGTATWVGTAATDTKSMLKGSVFA